MKQITSSQNALIKSLVTLNVKAKERLQTGTFLIEGRKEIGLAIKGKYEIETLLFLPEICSEALARELCPDTFLIEINRDVYQKLAYRESTEGVLAVARAKQFGLGDLILSKNPLIIVAESPEKPGNIGAILRTADAAKADAVIIANPRAADLYNPNIIRASIGCVFTTPVAMCTTSDIIAYLREREINIYCATLQNSNIYCLEDYTKPTAIVVGTESDGLTEDWCKAATKNIYIPMQGEIDSMNVSVAAAVIIFEAKRQRGF